MNFEYLQKIQGNDELKIQDKISKIIETLLISNIS